MNRSVRTIARESVVKAAGDTDADAAPRPLDTRDRRIITWTIALILLGGYTIWQVIGLATVKDEPPPSWLITAPAGATIIGEPRITREPYRATTNVTIRPADGRTNEELIHEMGLSEQPTHIGPTPLDWRSVWVYSRPTAGGVEIRLVYLRDSSDIITP